MKHDQKFFICKHCGNLIGMIQSSGVPIICCSEPMHELKANTAEAAGEKHLPVACLDNNCLHVQVGSEPHPMTEEHHIAWIYLQTDRGGQRKALKHTAKPEAAFCLADGEKPLAVFAYCNLHTLWKTDL